MNTPTHRHRTTIRVVFALFTIAQLTATHWPGLSIQSKVFSRIDLIIHASVFFVWTVLFYNARVYNARIVGLGDRSQTPCFKRRIIWTIVVGMLFAIFDETTQPLFNRVADPLDAMADTLGVLLAAASIALCAKRRRA